MIHVFDASALIAYVRRETGWELVANLLMDPNNTCYAHALNLCQVDYDHYRVAGEATAQAEISDLEAVGLIFRTDLDPAFWQQAGRHKARYRRVSIADCSCIALAQRVNGEVVTADRHEIGALAPLGLCPIRFIR
jgi:PIN domain nuclease of toxin-antitoxin system